MLLMQAQENGVVLDEEQLLCIAGGQTNTFDDDVDEALVQDLYVKDNVVQVVQSNVSSMPNDALMMKINDMHEQAAQCVSANEQNKVVNESLTVELARYKEQVQLYKKGQAKQIQPALYNGHALVKTKHAPAIMHDSEDTLEIAKTTRMKMLEKSKSTPWVDSKIKIAPPDYSKENYLAPFTPQRHLTPKQIFWSEDVHKHLTKVPKPITALTVFSELHDAYTVEQARCRELEAGLSKLKHKIEKDDHSEMIKHFSNLKVNHLNLQLKYQNLKESFRNNKSQTSQDAPEFDSFFEINKMKASLQGKDNAIRKLKEQISQMNERRS
ncbi:hypothetical protein Tco_0392721 [Tanacetum coccineum]